MRLPLEPLISASGLTGRKFRTAVKTFSVDIRRAEIKGLSLDAADRWAVRLNLHPFEVWGETWLNALESSQ